MKRENKENKAESKFSGKVKIILVAILTFVFCSNAFSAGTLTPINSGMKPAEILSHDVKVTIENGFSKTVVTQQFLNPNDKTIEAVYQFPLPKEASLSEVKILVGEREINGEVVPKKKAESIYNQEKKEGNNAGLATKNSYQNFQFNISNIKSQETATITFVYYQPLKIDTGVAKYLYPLENGNTDEAAKSFWITNTKVKNSATIEVTIKSAYPLTNVRTPQFNPSDKKEDLKNGKYSATFNLTGDLTKDFVLYYRLQDKLPGRLEVIPFKKENSKEGTFMMVVTPGIDLKPLSQGVDYIFVLDVSGSMTGGKIRTLKEGIDKVLQKLTANDRFKIVTFSDKANDFTNGWVAASKQNVEKWTNNIQQINAGGGTNLYDGLNTAFRNFNDDRATSVILVTDAVTNRGIIEPKKFYKLMKKYDFRMFSFLIGNNGNWPLMKTISKATGGYYSGISNSDDIIGQILLAKNKVTHECLHNSELKISGVKTYDLTNAVQKKVYYGQQLVIFGKYKGSGKATVTLKANLTGEDKTYTTDFHFANKDLDNPEIERLWALSRVEMFENQLNAGSLPESEVNSLICDLGVKYQIVTDETSMLVLSDESFNKYKIKRNNKERIAFENQAQTKRNTAPVKSYRVDNSKPMFKSSSSGIGGGAIDPFSALVMIFGALGACCCTGFKKYFKK